MRSTGRRIGIWAIRLTREPHLKFACSRARTAGVEWKGVPVLRIRPFGGFEARAGDGPAIGLPTKKTQALLAYRAMPPGEARTQEKLASLLWSEWGDEQARHSLRDALSGLHKPLGAAGVRDGRPNTASKKDLRLAARRVPHGESRLERPGGRTRRGRREPMLRNDHQ
jgi:hypothetical protein